MFQTLALVPCFVCTLCQHRAGWQSRVIAFITSHPSSSRIDQPAADLLCNGGSIKTDSSVTWHPPISHVKHRYSPSAAAAGWKKKKWCSRNAEFRWLTFVIRRQSRRRSSPFRLFDFRWTAASAASAPHTHRRAGSSALQVTWRVIRFRSHITKKKKKKSVSSFRPHK